MIKRLLKFEGDNGCEMEKERVCNVVQAAFSLGPH